MKKLSLALSIVLLASSCRQLEAATMPIWTEMPTPSTIITSLPMLTVTNTQEAPTQTPTPAADETPTPTGTATPSIYEVTPLGGISQKTSQPKLEALEATYAPYNTQNVRYGPGLDYAVRYRLAAGKTVRVYAWISNLPDEAWLCLDEAMLCDEAIVLILNHREYGELNDK